MCLLVALLIGFISLLGWTLAAWWRTRWTVFDQHRLFDQAFRSFVTRCQGPYQISPVIVGSCGSEAGPSGSAARIRAGLILPEWRDYAVWVDLRGCSALVSPQPHGVMNLTKKRVPGSLVYRLNRADDQYWYWQPLAGSTAGANEDVTGGMHFVAARSGHAPSDPTIEQFPGETMLYFVND